MQYPLAIFTPHIGALSESFIRRHVEDILPGRAVVITGTVDGVYLGHWGVNGPQLVIDRIPARAIPNGLRQHIAWTVARRLGRETPDSLPDPLTAIKQFLCEHHVRVILSEYLDHGLQWLKVARDLNVPFYGHGHGFDVSGRLKDPLWRADYLQYRQADGVITMSEVSRTRLIALGLPPEKIHVVPYGVDVPCPLPHKDASQDVHCLAIGRMVSKKAPILTLNAFRCAVEAHPNMRLDYVGTGELFTAAQHFVNVLKLDDQVRLWGGLPHDQVLSLMKQADVFIQHSVVDPVTGDEEGLPVSILEAMAQGLPVISTRHAGIPEAVIDGETGYLVEEGDSQAMAERIVALAKDIDLRRKMGVAGWQRAQERFSWNHERRQLLKILRLDDLSA
jgi:glycosyltransferase involved in cell wall biosynthesis